MWDMEDSDRRVSECYSVIACHNEGICDENGDNKRLIRENLLPSTTRHLPLVEIRLVMS